MHTPLRLVLLTDNWFCCCYQPRHFAKPAGRATHIVGGELDLQYQSGSTYRITLNLYFDALNGNPGALDQDLTVSIFEKGTNRRMQNVVLPLTTNTFVAYTNPACTQPSLSTRSLVYSRIVELPAGTYNNPGGYYAAVERCCRNNGISNIVLPGNAGQTFYLEFPAVVRNGQPFINSTPRIFPPLSDYACRGELFYYNFSGQDADSDSLVYELVTPLNGSSSPAEPKARRGRPAPYSSINWNPGLGTAQPDSGHSDADVSAALRAGWKCGLPNLGLFVFGMKCSEYRKGEKIGEVRRDFQLKVLNCPSNTPPEMMVLMPQCPARLPARPRHACASARRRPLRPPALHRLRPYFPPDLIAEPGELYWSAAHFHYCHYAGHGARARRPRYAGLAAVLSGLSGYQGQGLFRRCNRGRRWLCPPQARHRAGGFHRHAPIPMAPHASPPRPARFPCAPAPATWSRLICQLRTPKTTLLRSHWPGAAFRRRRWARSLLRG